MNTQQSDLSELLEAVTTTITTTTATSTHDQLRQLVEKNIKHFQDYKENRSNLTRRDVFPFFCSLLVHLLREFPPLDRRLPSFLILPPPLRFMQPWNRAQTHREFLQGLTTSSLVGGDLSVGQLCLVNILHCKTMREEVNMTSKLASLQENMADEPLAVIASNSSGVNCEANDVADEVMDEQEMMMASIMEEADELRMKTLKDLLSILTPLQGVVFLSAGKKLNLCIHEWGKKGDHLHGGN